MVAVCAWGGDLDQCVFKGMAEINPKILIPDFAFGKICPKGPQADKPAGGAAGGKFYVTPFRHGWISLWLICKWIIACKPFRSCEL